MGIDDHNFALGMGALVQRNKSNQARQSVLACLFRLIMVPNGALERYELH
jgi:hypothetical protein